MTAARLQEKLLALDTSGQGLLSKRGSMHLDPSLVMPHTRGLSRLQSQPLDMSSFDPSPQAGATSLITSNVSVSTAPVSSSGPSPQASAASLVTGNGGVSMAPMSSSGPSPQAGAASLVAGNADVSLAPVSSSGLSPQAGANTLITSNGSVSQAHEHASRQSSIGRFPSQSQPYSHPIIMQRQRGSMSYARAADNSSQATLAAIPPLPEPDTARPPEYPGASGAVSIEAPQASPNGMAASEDAVSADIGHLTARQMPGTSDVMQLQPSMQAAHSTVTHSQQAAAVASSTEWFAPAAEGVMQPDVGSSGRHAPQQDVARQKSAAPQEIAEPAVSMAQAASHKLLPGGTAGSAATDSREHISGPGYMHASNTQQPATAASHQTGASMGTSSKAVTSKQQLPKPADLAAAHQPPLHAADAAGIQSSAATAGGKRKSATARPRASRQPGDAHVAVQTAEASEATSKAGQALQGPSNDVKKPPSRIRPAATLEDAMHLQASANAKYRPAASRTAANSQQLVSRNEPKQARKQQLEATDMQHEQAQEAAPAAVLPSIALNPVSEHQTSANEMKPAALTTNPAAAQPLASIALAFAEVDSPPSTKVERVPLAVNGEAPNSLVLGQDLEHTHETLPPIKRQPSAGLAEGAASSIKLPAILRQQSRFPDDVPGAGISEPRLRKGDAGSTSGVRVQWKLEPDERTDEERKGAASSEPPPRSSRSGLQGQLLAQAASKQDDHPERHGSAKPSDLGAAAEAGSWPAPALQPEAAEGATATLLATDPDVGEVQGVQTGQLDTAVSSQAATTSGPDSTDADTEPTGEHKSTSASASFPLGKSGRIVQSGTSDQVTSRPKSGKQPVKKQNLVADTQAYTRNAGARLAGIPLMSHAKPQASAASLTGKGRIGLARQASAAPSKSASTMASNAQPSPASPAGRPLIAHAKSSASAAAAAEECLSSQATPAAKSAHQASASAAPAESRLMTRLHSTPLTPAATSDAQAGCHTSPESVRPASDGQMLGTKAAAIPRRPAASMSTIKKMSLADLRSQMKAAIRRISGSGEPDKHAEEPKPKDSPLEQSSNATNAQDGIAPDDSGSARDGLQLDVEGTKSAGPRQSVTQPPRRTSMSRPASALRPSKPQDHAPHNQLPELIKAHPGSSAASANEAKAVSNPALAQTQRLRDEGHLSGRRASAIVGMRPKSAAAIGLEATQRRSSVMSVTEAKAMAAKLRAANEELGRPDLRRRLSLAASTSNADAISVDEKLTDYQALLADASLLQSMRSSSAMRLSGDHDFSSSWLSGRQASVPKYALSTPGAPARNWHLTLRQYPTADEPLEEPRSQARSKLAFRRASMTESEASDHIAPLLAAPAVGTS